jgi:DNA-binding winged helix-turn-helix (wHTH) protein
VATRFGEFRLDPRRRQLFRGEDAVHLTPKAFELLTALVESRPQAMAKADLEARIWGRTHVAETSLAGLVAELRTALGESPREPRFIRTVHGFGYSFCGTAQTEPPASDPFRVGDLVYRIAWARREVSLRPGENVLGRDPDVVAWMDSPTVSRRHAHILVSAEGAVLEDLGSHNGTFVRGQRVTSPVALRDGDEIRLGSVIVTLRIGNAAETESESD